MLSLFLLSPLLAPQGVPNGYYDTVDDSSSATLRATLHQVIDDHQRYPYTSGSTDTWDILELAQEDPSNSSRIIDVYRNSSYQKQGGGNSVYNREHSWPRSYGFPDDSSINYPFTDCHALFLCDDGYNTARSNKPFRTCSSGCTEYTTSATNGQGGGSGSYPGNSNWTGGSFTNGSWETWIGRRGDVARAILYMDIRYEGGNHNVTGALEPNLIATDSLSLIDGSNTGSNEFVAYMGILSELIAWHEQDPPDDFERNRNDVVFAFQGNRNPFVDHPEWVSCLYLGTCSSPPIEAYCYGVGCPCGNDDAAGGCANSSGSGALLLEALGGPSVGADNLTLAALNVPSSQNGIFFMGASAISAPFGDGLRCVGAGGVGTFRYPVRNSGLSGTLLEGPGLVSFSQQNFGANGGIDPGETWYFQAWYRNPGGPCGTNFNLSNGLRVTFEP